MRAPPVPLPGRIPIGSHFSPVRRVKCAAVNTHVGRRTDYDKLTLDKNTVNLGQRISDSSEMCILEWGDFVPKAKKAKTGKPAKDEKKAE